METSARAVLIDLAGPASLIIEADLITELAQGRRLVELEDGGFGWLYRARAAEQSGPEQATTP